jgi:hypothetical protein
MPTADDIGVRRELVHDRGAEVSRRAEDEYLHDFCAWDAGVNRPRAQ